MTGSRVKLRRWSGCNLHWYAPGVRRRNRRRSARTSTTPFGVPGLLTRYRLYVAESDSYKQLRDAHGAYVWMTPDCGWEWLSTRRFIYHTRLFAPLDAVHDHVHTPHTENRMNVPLAVQRLAVRLLRSRTLDERWATNVFPDAHAYWIRVRFKDITEREGEALEQGLPDGTFNEITLFTGQYTTADWYEKASSPAHARTRAQQRVRALGLSLGGTFWENPVRLKTRETAE